MAKQISYKHFLKLLSKSPRDWRIERGGQIRSTRVILGGFLRCPWMWVRFHLGKSIVFTDALTSEDIFIAADFPSESSACNQLQKRIRRDLLKACSLKESSSAKG